MTKSVEKTIDNNEREHMKSVWLVKQDARLLDNKTIDYAFENSQEILPVFCFEPIVYRHPDYSHFHHAAITQSLCYLSEKIQQQGGSILFIHGDICDALAELKTVYDFSLITSHEEVRLKHTYDRDKALKTWCADNGVIWHETVNNGIKRALKNRDMRMSHWNYNIQDTPFLPVNKDVKWANIVVDSANIFHNIDSVPFEKTFTSPKKGFQVCNEKNALFTLQDFLNQRSKNYRGGISSMNRATKFGSRLSIHLAWGTVSMRYVYQSMQQKISELQKQINNNRSDYDNKQNQWHLKSLRHFSSRLYWHDHFVQRLEDEWQIEFHPINSAFSVVDYPGGNAHLVAWLEGQTGYPAIDAAMRCFRQTGFLNFRSRAMVTSFAIHGLQLDWRDILYPMARYMADYVPGIHVAQVQMQAGITGINTIRVYSPTKQIIDKDPDCVFIKKWIPELTQYSAEQIIGHVDSPLDGYIAPIVDFKSNSKYMKDQLWGIKKGIENNKIQRIVLDKHGSKFRSNIRSDR